MVRSIDGVPISRYAKKAGPSVLDMQSGSETASLTVALSYESSGLHPMRITAESLRTWTTEYRPACHHCAQDFGGMFEARGDLWRRQKTTAQTIAVTNKRMIGSTNQSVIPYANGMIDVLLRKGGGATARDHAQLRCQVRKSVNALKRVAHILRPMLTRSQS